MEKVEDVDGLSVESLEALVDVLDLEVSFNSKDVHSAAFHEEYLPFAGVSSVSFIVHLDPVGLFVVLTDNDIKDWDMVDFDIFILLELRNRCWF